MYNVPSKFSDICEHYLFFAFLLGDETNWAKSESWMVKNGRTSDIQRSGQMVETSDWTTDEQIVGVGAQTSKGYKFVHLIDSHKLCFHFSRRRRDQ